MYRRLAVLEGRFTTLAAENQFREVAVRNIAMEIFGAQPNLDFDTYVSLIESGTRDLRVLLTEVRTHDADGPAVAALRAEALAAAERGHLADARRLYDRLINDQAEAIEERWAREDRQRQAERNAQRLNLAADMAHAAQLAFVVSDYEDAARRYGAALSMAPEDNVAVRWRYSLSQAAALINQGMSFGNSAKVEEGITVLEGVSLRLITRESQPVAWSQTHHRIALAYMALYGLGEYRPGRAIAAARETLTVPEAARIAAYHSTLSEALVMEGEAAQRELPSDAEAATQIAAAIDVAREAVRLAQGGDARHIMSANSALMDALVRRAGTIEDVEARNRLIEEALRAAEYVAQSAALQTLASNDRAVEQMRIGLTRWRAWQASPAPSPELLAGAIANLREAEATFSPVREPVYWLRARLELAQALTAMGARAETDLLLEADALWRETFAAEWPRSMAVFKPVYSLMAAETWQLLGERGHPDRLHLAADALRVFLTSEYAGRDRDTYAYVRFSLGTVLLAIGRRGDAGTLRLARATLEESASDPNASDELRDIARAALRRVDLAEVRLEELPQMRAMLAQDVAVIAEGDRPGDGESWSRFLDAVLRAGIVWRAETGEVPDTSAGGEVEAIQAVLLRYPSQAGVTPRLEALLAWKLEVRAREVIDLANELGTAVVGGDAFVQRTRLLRQSAEAYQRAALGFVEESRLEDAALQLRSAASVTGLIDPEALPEALVLARDALQMFQQAGLSERVAQTERLIATLEEDLAFSRSSGGGD